MSTRNWVIEGKEYKRILAISDIHGCYGEFVELLEKSEYNPKEDKLVLLGDYIDRGTQSREVVAKVRELVEQGATAIQGNHEQMLSLWWNEVFSLGTFHRNGGKETLDSYGFNRDQLTSDMRWFNALPKWYETDDFIFVHAGLNVETLRPETSNDTELLWSRYPWLKCYNGGDKTVIFGHTPHSEVAALGSKQGKPNKFCIDTGCVFGYKLSCFALEPNSTEYVHLQSMVYSVDKREF